MFVFYYMNIYCRFDSCVALGASNKRIVSNKTTAGAYGFRYRRYLSNWRSFNFRFGIARQAEASVIDSPVAGFAFVRFFHCDR